MMGTGQTQRASGASAVTAVDDLERAIAQIRAPNKHAEIWAELDRDNEVRRVSQLDPPSFRSADCDDAKRSDTSAADSWTIPNDSGPAGRIERWLTPVLNAWEALWLLTAGLCLLAIKVVAWLAGWGIVIGAVYWVTSGIRDGLTPKRYAAEVGYYSGRETAWDLWGDFDDLDACKSAAIARYNFYFADNERAHSWSCLLKSKSGGYVSRHR